MASGDNWTKEETKKQLKIRAQKTLDNIKIESKSKRFRYVKISDRPLTIKEIEIKD